MNNSDEPPKSVPEMNGYESGDSVKVKDAIIDPDDEKVCIGNWRGRIKEIYEDGIALIEWDSITIREMDIKRIKKFEKEGYEWGEIYLGLDELNHCDKRDNLDNASEEISKIQWQYFRNSYF